MVVKAHNAGRPRSQRQLKIGEVLRHALSQILTREEINDPDFKGIVLTVTEVRVSPDLRNATVFVIPLGGMGQADLVPKTLIETLKRLTPFFRKHLARRVYLRYVPHLSFQYDASFDNGQAMDNLLRRANDSNLPKE